MAFDLVQYFAEQIKIQKPQLLRQYSSKERCDYLSEVNALTLGRLIHLWRTDSGKIYQEIQTQDQLYIQEIARHLTTSDKNKSTLSKEDLEQTASDILSLQLCELKQLDDTGNFGQTGVRELLLGQIEHLSGQAKDWVWQTNELTELVGSQPIVQEEISLNETMKEFNQMVNTQTTEDHLDAHKTLETIQTTSPSWAKVVEPMVALVVLWGLFCALQSVFA